MKVDVKIQLLKFSFTLFNSVFLALGLSVAGVAIWILFDTGNFLNVLPTDELRTVGAGLLVTGGVVLLVGVVGCFGAHGENRFFLLMYLGFLIVIFLGQLFVSLLLILSGGKIKQSLDAVVDQTIFQYGGNHTNTDRLLDNMQHYGKCCGRMGPADWLKNSFIQSLNLTNPDVRPCSCFLWSHPSLSSPWCSDLLNITNPLFGQGNMSYEQGCEKQLGDWLQENALTIIGMDVCLILIQVVAFVLTVYLRRAFGRKAALKDTNPLVDDHTHLGHNLDYGEENHSHVYR